MITVINDSGGIDTTFLDVCSKQNCCNLLLSPRNNRSNNLVTKSGITQSQQDPLHGRLKLVMTQFYKLSILAMVHSYVITQEGN